MSAAWSTDDFPLGATAAVLKAHKLTESLTSTSESVCACGLIFHRIDARTWERHVAAMLLNAGVLRGEKGEGR